MKHPDFYYGSDTLGIETVIGLASGKLSGDFSEEAEKRIKASQQQVAGIVRSGKTV
jgi:hypothetical protein